MRVGGTIAQEHLRSGVVFAARMRIKCGSESLLCRTNSLRSMADGAAAEKKATGAAAEKKATVEASPDGGSQEGKYSWSQTLNEVAIVIPLPASTTSKMLDISIQRQSINVGIKGGKSIFSGPLVAPVQPDECFWTFEKGQVEITLNKVRLFNLLSPMPQFLNSLLCRRKESNGDA
jgi:hypothetical protein